MKKMQCESCGGQLEINEDEEYATCPFCKTKYKLNEEKNIYFRLDDDVKKGLKVFGKFSLITFIVGSLISLTIIVSVIILFVNIFKNFNNSINNQTNSHIIDKVVEKASAEDFNFGLETYSGSNSGRILENLFDNIIKSNKKNPEMLITVNFNEQSTNDVEEIKNIKQVISSSSDKYDVDMVYDDKGYITIVNIVKEKISVKDFNSKFEHYTSFNNGFFIQYLLEDVITSNKKNTDMLITVNFNGQSTSDTEVIRNMKQSVNTYAKYNVNITYDDAGYITTITISAN